MSPGSQLPPVPGNCPFEVEYYNIFCQSLRYNFHDYLLVQRPFRIYFVDSLRKMASTAKSASKSSTSGCTGQGCQNKLEAFAHLGRNLPRLTFFTSVSGGSSTKS
jgi:hypothetical protein